MGIHVMPFDLQQQRKQYRAPFKVQFVQWNPTSDLLALASRKGEIMVKRNAWKRCWKVNVSELTAFPETQCTKPALVESMTWSPDGAILAVAMNDGHLHLIEAEEGVVRWSRSLGPGTCAQKMRWFWSGDPPPAKTEYVRDWQVYDEVKAVASIFSNGYDILDERISKTLLYENLYKISLKKTILFMIRDDLVILALAGGLIPITEIRLADKLAHLKLDVISVYDILYSQQDGLTIAVTDYGPRPKLEEIDREAVHKRSSARLSGESIVDPLKGEGAAHPEKKFGVPTFVPDSVSCPHSHLINLNFKLEHEKLLWDLLLGFLRMYHCLLHFVYSVEMSKKDWESESKIFANRLNSSARDLRLGDSLLNSLLGGAPGPLADRWLERTLGLIGIHSMHEFVEKRFSGLVAFLRGQVSGSARVLAYQMDQYREIVKEIYDATTDYEKLTLPRWGQLSPAAPSPQATDSVNVPDVTADCKFDALEPEQAMAILERLHTDGIRIQAKSEEMTLTATNNLRELSHLVRWMSLLTPLLKNAKRPAQVIEENRRWDVAQLLEYLVQTFVTEPEERERLTKSLFKVEEILKEMRAEETKENFDEDELMRDLVEECSLTKDRDDRSLGELLAAGRKGTGSIIDSPMCGPSETSTPRTNPNQRPLHSDYVLDKVQSFWGECLDKASLDLLGDRFALDGLSEVIRSTEKSLQTVVNEAIHTVQASSLLAIQSNADMSVKWMYELASGSSHCGYDSVRLSPFRWSKVEDQDNYERKLFSAKGKDLEGAICVSTVSRDGLSCECLLPHAVGKLKAGVQTEMSLAVVMQPGGIVETTPVQTDTLPRNDQPPEEGQLQLVTDENIVFGDITRFLSVDTYAGGYVYALATFKSEAGEVNRLMRKHPAIEAWFVHNALLSEVAESTILSTDRKQGCVISEEGTRVALFRVQSTPEEQQSTLLTEAPPHRPALQLLSHHHLR